MAETYPAPYDDDCGVCGAEIREGDPVGYDGDVRLCRECTKMQED